MSVLRVLRHLMSHPVNRDRKAAALWRFAKWQVGSRLVPGKVAVNWIEGATFLAGASERGATGNVYCGLHEFHDMAYVLHVLRKDDWFADVGANVGSYTILACKVAGARGYCFEPVPSSYRRLMMNLAINDLLEQVTPLNQGVGDRSQTLRFTSEQDCTNHVLADGESSENAIEVPIATLDESMATTPSMMKIDVEGYETLALQGAARVLADRKLNSILIELNGSGERYGFDESQIVSNLNSFGFKAYAYDAFQRKLTPTSAAEKRGGNTLFIRDVELASRLVREAPRFNVLGKQV